MAGIFGVLGSVSESDLSEMENRLSHRGIFTCLEHIADELVFGSIGLEGEQRVRVNESGAIVSDAIIYNIEELLAAPRSVDFGVDPSRDEDLLFSLYMTEGLKGLAKLNGDFAFALWDREKQELTLGRDFFGCHPLYYSHLPAGGLAFASEYKALLAIEEIQPIPDLDMLQHLQYVKRLPIGRTLLKNVASVLPGGIAVFDSCGEKRYEERLPGLELNVTYEPEEVLIPKVREALCQAVKVRTEGRDKVGFALSGGIDSIALTCIYRYLNPDRQYHTFTAGHGVEDPEMSVAAGVARAMRSTHHQVITGPELLLTDLPSLVYHLEDPFARSETLQLYRVAQEARQDVNVLMSGQGSDGLFAGMQKYKLLWYIQNTPLARKPLKEFYDLSQLGLKPESISGKLLREFYFRGGLPDVPKVRGTDYSPSPTKFPPNEKEFVNLMAINGYSNGVSLSLQKFERTFSSAGLTYTSPNYDLNLVRTAFSVPQSLKIKAGQQKYIFRKALQSIVPEEYLNVPKFPQQMKYDLGFSNTLDEIADIYLSQGKVSDRGFFEYSEILKLRKRKQGNPYSSEGAMRLWSVLLTEIWATNFLDHKGVRPEYH
jgi:asparagine synthase (glutamine-hydrolysing)